MKGLKHLSHNTTKRLRLICAFVVRIWHKTHFLMAPQILYRAKSRKVYLYQQHPSNEPQHDKTNKMMCAPSKDSDQPGHPLSAWKNHGTLATHWVHSEDSDQTGWTPRLIWAFAGRTHQFVGFVVMRLKLLTSFFQKCICFKICLTIKILVLNEPSHEKICLWGFATG